MGRVSVKLGATIPALPCADVERSVVFYRDRLGFGLVHQEDGFASLHRDAATVHLWGASDEGWRIGLDPMRPVRSGAESFIAGTASCSVQVEGVDELYAHCSEHGIVHPNGHIGDQPWGVREFGIIDPDGNLVTFWQKQ